MRCYCLYTDSESVERALFEPVQPFLVLSKGQLRESISWRWHLHTR